MKQNLHCNPQKLQRLWGFPLGKWSRWFCEDCADFVIFLRSPRNHFWGFVRGSPYGLCWLLLHPDARVANLHLPVRFPMDQPAEPKQIAELRLNLWSFLLLFSGSHLLLCARIQPYIHYSYNKNNTSVNITMPGNRNHTCYEYKWDVIKLFLLFFFWSPSPGKTWPPLGGPTCLHSCLLQVTHIILFKQTPWQQWCKQINVNERIHPSENNKKEGKRGWGEQSNNSSDGALFKKALSLELQSQHRLLNAIIIFHGLQLPTC